MNTPQMDVSELYKRRESKDAARLKAYNQILESIYHRIRAQSRLPNSPCSLLYTIPPFILGLPRIDLEDCVVYLVHQLRNAGFAVKFTFPNLIGISWVHHERDYILEQSPIMQALLSTTKKEPKSMSVFNKKPKKVKNPHAETIAPKKSVSISPYALTSGPSAGKAPSASDYVPPSVFVNTIVNPEPREKPKGFAQQSQTGVLADLWNL
jgi:hypothetical protein